MADQSLIFNATMIEAWLADRKWATRRVAQPQPTFEYEGNYSQSMTYSHTGRGIEGVVGVGLAAESWNFGLCPYGEPGDTVWFRETCARYHTVNHARRPSGASFAEISDGLVVYKADGHETIEDARDHIRMMSDSSLEDIVIENDKWRSPIHMFRWASRLERQIVDTRIERVQDISEEDAEAEGCNKEWYADMAGTLDLWPCRWCQGFGVHPMAYPPDYGVMEVDCSHCDTSVRMFEQLWNSINDMPKPVHVRDDAGKRVIDHYVSYPWEDRRETIEYRGKLWHIIGNPFVRVIEFTRAEP